MLGISAGRVAA